MTPRQFLYGVLLLTVLLMISRTTGDPDLWGHVRFGRDMLEHGAIRVPDTYSFTTDRPWVNHEWLSEVAMAAAFERLGPAGLNLLRMAVIGAVLMIVWRGLAGVREPVKVLIVSAGAVGIHLRAHPIRPQLFSLLMLALLLALMDRSDDRKSLRPLALVPVLMAVWVNCHGGWIVGFGVFGLWSLMTALTLSWRHRMALAGLGTFALAATLLNPYGVGMWEFLGTTVRAERPYIADWQPLYTLPYALWGSWIAGVGLTAMAAAQSRYRGHEKQLAIAIVLGLMAIRVSRLDAFFAIAAMFFAARALRQPCVATVPIDQSSQRGSRVLTAGFAMCLVGASIMLVPQVLTVPVSPRMMPDKEVASYVHAQRLKGNVLTWFDWGQYAIWHFGPELKVSMDGRRETVYSADTVDAHMRFYRGEPGAWRYADLLQPDYVWIPKELPVVADLRRNGWNPLCEGSSSILLTRRPVTESCGPAGTPRSGTPFPQL